jgi:membrane-bound lytic murein transglycosylase A
MSSYARSCEEQARSVVACLVGAILCVTAGAASAQGSPQAPLKLAGSQLEPVKWSELAGWTADDHLEAFVAYQAGCRILRRTPRTDDSGPIHGALSNVCRKAIGLRPQDSHTARAFFEQNFQPVRIARLGESEGLLTGYFEPIVAGSRFPSPEFPIPLYRRPRDLVAAGYKQGSTAFPNKGVRIGRRTESNELVPYHDRGAIEAGALDGQKLEICWLKDPFDLLAIQIEGSGRVILEDGTPLRISYDSHNGYGYSSFERVLVERNLFSRKEMSKERIRAWMAAYPEEAAKVRATNRAYAFFRITGLTNDGEPVGAQGVPLTPGRSIAVDRVHEYGTPFFIEANLPIEGVKPASPFRRLMIAQDTGSAIVGPARADLYLGAGEDAGRIAGRIRHPGRFVMLLPRELDMVAAGNEMPLPVPKPKIAEIEVAKADGKGKAELAGARATTDGRSMPSPAPKPPQVGVARLAHSKNVAALEAKPKLAALEVKKPDGKGKTEPAGATAAGKQMPQLPAPKTKILATEVKKQDGKGRLEPASSGPTAAGKQMPSPAPKSKILATEVKKLDGKAKAESASSGATAAGKQVPSPAPKTKIPATEAKKPDGKGKAEPASSGATAAGRQKPSPASKPPQVGPARLAHSKKTPATEVKKQDSKGKAESGDDRKAAAKPDRQAASARKSSRSLN